MGVAHEDDMRKIQELKNRLKEMEAAQIQKSQELESDLQSKTEKNLESNT